MPDEKFSIGRNNSYKSPFFKPEEKKNTHSVKANLFNDSNKNIKKPYMSLTDLNNKLNGLNKILNDPAAKAEDKKAAKDEMEKLKKQVLKTDKTHNGAYETRAAKSNGNPETPIIDFKAVNQPK